MRVRRLLAGVITAGLVAPAAAVLATPTSASAAIATTIVPAYSDRPAVYGYSRPLEYGDDLTAYADVVGADGKTVYSGALTVQRQLPGESGWTTVATDNSAGLYVSGMKAVGNATYRITYHGNGTYAPSTLDVTVKAGRKIDAKSWQGKSTGVKGKVKPKQKNVKIKLSKKVGKKFKKVRTYKTNKKGAFKIPLPAPAKGRWYWKVTFVGGKKFQSTTLKYSTYRRAF